MEKNYVRCDKITLKNLSAIVDGIKYDQELPMIMSLYADVVQVEREGW